MYLKLRNGGDRAQYSSHGFTLIELVVTLAVIGMLLALLLPAVQASRASARNIECRNHLRQIGIAVAEYDSSYSVLPVENSLHTRLLPYLGFSAAFRDLESLNGVASVPKVPCYVCPSDSESGREPFATNYSLNDGSTFTGCGRNGMRKVFSSPLQWTRMSDVVDGTSSTVAMSERLIERSQGDPVEASAVPERYIWFTASSFSGCNQVSQFASECRTNRVTPFPLLSVNCVMWVNGPIFYNHILTPNSISCHNGSAVSTMSLGFGYSAIAASSEHGSGVNSLFLDGSVKFMSSSIGERVWTALGSRNGREVVSVK